MNKYCLFGVLITLMFLVSCQNRQAIITQTICRDTVVATSAFSVFGQPEIFLNKTKMCRDTVIVLDYREVPAR